MKAFINDAIVIFALPFAFGLIPFLSVYIYFRERRKVSLLRIISRMYGYLGRSIEENFG